MIPATGTEKMPTAPWAFSFEPEISKCIEAGAGFMAALEISTLAGNEIPGVGCVTSTAGTNLETVA
ncbi:MAG TPA: hypothetical protein VHB46_17200 [Burkholderiales bacterium]|nr:hypothetical protein [Burkholderiales bacterium]